MTDIQIEISSGVGANTDGTMTFTHMRPFVNATNVRLGAPVTAPRVMTNEHNQAILDGSREEFPDDPTLFEWGVMSDVVSGSDGAFATRPAINRTWTTPQTSGGITLIPYEPGENFARRVSATWYSQSGGVLSSGEYDLDADGVIENSVANFYRINIEFISTNIPRRMVWLRRVSYGILFLGRNDDVSTCRAIEEAPESSDIAPSGTLDFSIVVQSLRMRNVLKTVKNGALLPMKLVLNGRRFGSFFIDQSEDVHGDGSKFNIRALSPVGAMDNTRFYGGMYSNKSVPQLVTEIMQTAFTRGEITATVGTGGLSTVTGYMPICTCREALQQVAFASDKSISCTRNGVINIQATRQTAPATNRIIPLSEIYQGESKITQTSQYTSVDVTGYVYQLNEDRQIIIVYATLSSGDYTYEFSEPLGNLFLSGASFVQYGANHAVIRVASSTTVLLRGTTYIKTAQTYRVNGMLSSAARENICRFDSTLLYSPNVPNIALHLWSDASRSVVRDDAVVLKDTAAGDYVLPERSDGVSEVSRVERLDIDLRGNKAIMRTLTGRIDGTLQPAPEIPQPPFTQTTFTATGTGQFGTIQTFTAPVTGTYTFSAYGAGGGNAGSGGVFGGKGAYVKMSMRLNAGDVLDILVGQEGRVGARMLASGKEGYIGSGGGGYTAAFIRRPTGRFSRLGVNFDCVVLAAGGGGGGFIPSTNTPYHGLHGNASNIYTPSSPDQPLNNSVDPNDTTPQTRYPIGYGIYQYINYGGAGANILNFTVTYGGIITVYDQNGSMGGFGGGASAWVYSAIGVTGFVGGVQNAPGGGGGWQFESVDIGISPLLYTAYSWCSETIVEGISGYQSGNGQMKIEWTPG